jgi:hypothetical protein
LIINSDESGPLSNWGFAMGYWIADGDPEPEVPFPKDWEVCGVPDFDPLAFRPEYKRHVPQLSHNKACGLCIRLRYQWCSPDTLKPAMASPRSG